MNVVGRVSSLITQGVYSVATPFHPFGGAVDIIVVQQQNGSYRSTPWYVRFGKFQGVLKGAEKIVKIEVNGSEANFHMNLDNSGEAYFIKEVPTHKENEKSEVLDNSDSLEGLREGNDSDFASEANSRKDSDRGRHKYSDSGEDGFEIRDERVTLGMDRLERTESDAAMFYDFQDVQYSLDTPAERSECSSSQSDHLDDMGHVLESHGSSEVILVSVDGHILTAPITLAEKHGEILNLNTELKNDSTEFSPGEHVWTTDYLDARNISPYVFTSQDSVDEHKECANIIQEYKSARIRRGDVFRSCLELTELANHIERGDHFKKDPLADSSEHPENMKEGCLSSPRAKYENDIYSSVTTPALSVADVTFGKSPLDSDNDILDIKPNKLDNLDSNPEEHNQLLPEGDNAESEELLVGPKVEEHNVEEDIIFETGCIKCDNPESQLTPSCEDTADFGAGLELSICKNLLHPGIGSSIAAEIFYANLVSEEDFKLSASSIIKNENLVVRYKGKYLPWEKAAPVVLGLAAYGLDLPIYVNDPILVENEMLKNREGDSGMSLAASGRRWGLWSMPFRRHKTLEHTSSISSNEELFVDSESVSRNSTPEQSPTKSFNEEVFVDSGSVSRIPTPEQSPTKSFRDSPRKQYVRTNVPTSDQIESLNLKEGQNIVTFIFSTRVLGLQKVDAHIYLWKYNARIVISDVDGTITKSDVLGQFMPLVGKDWTHSGIARLFSAIKENGYQLLFLSARAIVQAYLTRSFLFNLKQDGKSLPSGPVVISPDGLFPSLYREVIRRAPHEFKIACLEDIKALFPSDYNPFYAGFGNRNTDELSYRKIGIPKGKIFIINPKGEVAINNRVDVKSYTSLHTLVHDMFPPTSSVGQEDYNSWNFWKMPLMDIDDL